MLNWKIFRRQKLLSGKRLFDKLALACGDEILDTTETSLDD